jgi:integrin beta 3
MEQRDLDAIIRGIAPVIKTFVSQSLAGVTERLVALEARPFKNDEESEAKSTLADALDEIVVEQKREWRLEHAKEIAEIRAILADARRENAEARAKLKEECDVFLASSEQRIAAALAQVRDGEAGPQGIPGPPGESIRGERGPAGVGIAGIERDGDSLVVKLDDQRELVLGPLPKGDQGPAGAPVPSIVAGSIDDDGHLVLKMSDGNEIDVGNARGRPGKDGAPGVGVAAVERDGNRLIVVLDDEHRIDVGELPKGDPGESVVGPPGPAGESIKGDPGVGIAAIEREGDNLIVRLDDLSSIDLGQLPRGDIGPEGPPGPASEGPAGRPGVGLRSFRRDGDNVIAILDDEREIDIGPLPKGDRGDSIVGPQGPAGESIRGEKGDPGVGIAAIERSGDRLFFILDDERTFDAGELPRGERGETGPAGRDGVSFVDGFVDRSGALILTRDDGTTREIRDVAGRDGKDGAPGRDGRDGFGFEDISVAYDGQRQFSIQFVRGAETKQFDFEVPVALYRGVFRDGETYRPGDLVTKGGSLWYCDTKTADPPGDGKPGWTLAAKRGRDGRDGKDGERGPPGPEGPRGRDLTQLGPDGARF